jgi:hypothetical protein
MNESFTDPNAPPEPRDEPVVTSDGAVRELEKASLADSSDHTSPELRDLPPEPDEDADVLPLAKDPDGAPEEPDADASDVSNQ